VGIKSNRDCHSGVEIFIVWFFLSVPMSNWRRMVHKTGENPRDDQSVHFKQF
jgi:hypothetical protein